MFQAEKEQRTLLLGQSQDPPRPDLLPHLKLALIHTWIDPCHSGQPRIR